MYREGFSGRFSERLVETLRLEPQPMLAEREELEEAPNPGGARPLAEEDPEAPGPSAAAGSTESGEGGSVGPAPPPPCSGVGQARR